MFLHTLLIWKCFSLKQPQKATFSKYSRYLSYLEQSTEDLDEIIKEIVRLSNDITELGESENEA